MPLQWDFKILIMEKREQRGLGARKDQLNLKKAYEIGKEFYEDARAK